MGRELNANPDLPIELAVTRVPAFEDNYFWLIHGAGASARKVAVVDPGDARNRARGTRGTGPRTRRDPRDPPPRRPRRWRRRARATASTSRSTVPPGRTSRGARPPSPRAMKSPCRPWGCAFGSTTCRGTRPATSRTTGMARSSAATRSSAAAAGACSRARPPQMLSSLDKLARAAARDAGLLRPRIHGREPASSRRQSSPGTPRFGSTTSVVSALRARHEPTIPTTLGLETRINPFLRTRLPSVREAATAHAGQAPADDAAAFAVVREWKNGFR